MILPNSAEAYLILGITPTQAILFMKLDFETFAFSCRAGLVPGPVLAEEVIDQHLGEGILLPCKRREGTT